MIAIISFQKYKSLGEILYYLNNKSLNYFRTIEILNFLFFLALVSLNLIIRILELIKWTFGYFKELSLKEVRRILPTVYVIILTGVFIILLIVLKKY